MHCFRETLGKLEKLLEPKGFIRIHKGFLVNQLYISSIQADEIKMPDGKSLPVGRAYRDSARSRFIRYMR
jgi:DNA-binding LytR/AlgR family response regulator